LVVFFAIAAVIHDQHLFTPAIDLLFSLQGRAQLAAYFLADGILSIGYSAPYWPLVHRDGEAGRSVHGHHDDSWVSPSY
jgi:hypothetical protein